MHGRRAATLLVLVLIAVGCGRGRSEPSPPTTGGSGTTTPATEARVPKVTADAIPGLDPAGVHGDLERLGFTTGAPVSAPGIVTTTSTSADATVSTYGKGATDVVKLVAEASTDAAPSVLAAVAKSAIRGPDGAKAETWVRAELTRGPIRPTQPRTARATYGGEDLDLLVTASTGTLSIGSLTS